MKFFVSVEESYRQQILDELIVYNQEHGQTPYFKSGKNITPKKPFGVYCLEENEQFLGGAVVYERFDWLYVDILFLNPNSRKHGLGSQLLAEIQRIAQEKDCVGINLETWDFQARAFYEKNGFEVCGKIEDYPRGNTLYNMIKRV